MTNINVLELVNTCDKINCRCTQIAGTHHGSAWLFDKMMRFFESNPSAVSVTIPVYINTIGPGSATIGRDGSLIMKKDA